MVACFFPAADLFVDAGGLQARGELGAEQEMIDAQACVAAVGIAEIIPECIDHFGRMQFPYCVGPSLCH